MSWGLILFQIVISIFSQDEQIISSTVYVKQGGNETFNGLAIGQEKKSLKSAYGLLRDEMEYTIKVVKDTIPLTAEAITFNKNKGITIEGVNGTGEGNTEVAIDCNVSASSALFTCEKKVDIKYLAFNFPTSGIKWTSLISGNEMLASLTISNCLFVRVGSQLPDNVNLNVDEDGSIVGNLVSVIGGKVSMSTVTCTDNGNTVSFSSSPFSFSSVSSASLNGVEISNANVQNGAAITIENGGSTHSAVSIEGLSMNGVNSENGKVAGMEISLSSKESTVAVGRKSKCTFKSCTAPKGKAGAIFIEMPKATSNLQLPSTGNLDIDSSNTAGSKSTSLFIVAPDLDEFCKQEDAFEFANDYDNSTVGWIVGATDEVSEPADVYEKYLKGKKDKPKKDGPKEEEEDEGKDRNKGAKGVPWWIIVVVAFTLIAAGVFCVVFVAVKRKRRIFKKKKRVFDEEGVDGPEGEEEEEEEEREEEGGEREERENEGGREIKDEFKNKYKNEYKEESEKRGKSRQQLYSTTHGMYDSTEQFEPKEKKEGISSELIEEAVNHILSSSSSSDDNDDFSQFELKSFS
ncbi:uncharacterized protein MONOS_4583 [Monocercomonoides exilis]|uniref:uncharacterized protein n=1 Tax=Monocercomonoides exilis TaxID=2049356 RepID=UPI003559A6A3|nr:hypothetical protein MONOS_4583 [Monocercomonoides exilis]|eukprot:MONOS_4583.1-p1 / transcript=MONOS_4583.1 / gene=MONOS_4583 / organism=Monocercomonoides_exilis_PA203 / gene_product=unspecified product / transcript_product=unspecified product / location=Mono_scaffold00123:62311-64032(-) / protein_length=574 / sequence_SO=supercontig / SO=protein_coding / is_pseudo=false